MRKEEKIKSTHVETHLSPCFCTANLVDRNGLDETWQKIFLSPKLGRAQDFILSYYMLRHLPQIWRNFGGFGSQKELDFLRTQHTTTLIFSEGIGAFRVFRKFFGH